MNLLTNLGKWWWKNTISGSMVGVMFWAPLVHQYMLLPRASAAPAPEWWSDREAVDPEKAPAHFAAVTAGQLKWLATTLYDEFETTLPLGAQLADSDGNAITLDDFFAPPKAPHDREYDAWSAGNAAAVNLGQAKHLTQKFYRQLNAISPAWVKAQLVESGLMGDLTDAQFDAMYQDANGHYYPWTDEAGDDENRALINQGQLKLLFALRLRQDSEANPDGLPDIFEHALIAMPDAQYANYIGQAGAINPFKFLSLDEITQSGGDLNVSIQEGDTLSRTPVAIPSPGLASANASVASLLAEHQPVGSVGGSLSVASDGSASYSIPIQLPAGTSGMTPNISLNYSSNGGNGLLGVGFSISGLQSITRGPTSLRKDGFNDPVDFDTNDRFYIDGDLLVCIRGEYGVIGSEYRTEKDSYSRIKLEGYTYTDSQGSSIERRKWVIETKAGLKIFLGGCRSSCSLGDPTNVTFVNGNELVWSVNRVEDVYGNYYQVIYEQVASDGQANDYRPALIRYTGNDTQSLAPYIQINFLYDDAEGMNYVARPDQTYGYIAGTQVAMSHRLKRIEVSSFEVLNYSYNLSYIDERAKYRAGEALNRALYLAEWQTLRSKLDTIQRVAGTGETLPPTQFAWTHPTSSATRGRWLENSSYLPDVTFSTNDQPDLGYRWLDMNSDGNIDLIKSYADSLEVSNFGGSYSKNFDGKLYFNDGETLESREDIYKINNEYYFHLAVAYSNNKDYGIRIIDINSDGNLDLVRSQDKTQEIPINQVPHLLDPSKLWNVKNCYLEYIEWEWGGEIYTTPDIFFDLERNGEILYGHPFIFFEEGIHLHDSDVIKDYDKFISMIFLHKSSYEKGEDGKFNFIYDPEVEIFDTNYAIGRSVYSGDEYNAKVEVNISDTWPTTKVFSQEADRYYFKGHVGSIRDGDKEIPLNFSDSSDKTLGTEFLDINGDGRVDILQSDWTNQQIFLQNEDGSWREDPSYILPTEANTRIYRNTTDRDKGNRWIDFMDINGDSQVDIVQSIQNDDVSHRKTWLRESDGWVESLDYKTPISMTKTNGDDTGVDFLDINGDGLPDIVEAIEVREEIIPLSLIPVEHHWREVSSSHVTHGKYFGRAGGGHGGGEHTHATALIQNVVDPSKSHTIYHHAKGNSRWKNYHHHSQPNPAMEDYVKLGEVYVLKNVIPDNLAVSRTWINTGLGFELAHDYSSISGKLPRAVRSSNKKSKGVKIADFNGDGLPDFLESNFHSDLGEDGTDEINVVWLNDGRGGWTKDETFRLPDGVRIYHNQADIDSDRQHAEFIDVNGDGFLDIIHNTYTASPKVYLNQSKPEMITKITDGFGSNLQINYERANAPGSTVYVRNTGASATGQINVPMSGYLVRSYSESDGFGGRRTTSQRYGGRVVDRTNETDLGFEWVETTTNSIEYGNRGASLDAVTHSPRQRTLQILSQQYPFQGSPLAGYVFVEKSAGSNAWILLSKEENTYSSLQEEGVTVAEPIMENSGTTHGLLYPIQKTTESFKYSLDGAGTALSLADHPQLSTIYDKTSFGTISGTTISQLLISSNETTNDAFDPYGNILGQTARFKDASGAPITTSVTTNIYTNNITDQKWHLGRLTSASVTKTINNPAYFSSGAEPSTTKNSSFSYYPTTGVLKTETAQPGHAQAVTKTYYYDGFGNKTGEVINDSTTKRATATIPDEYGRFTVSEHILVSGNPTFKPNGSHSGGIWRQVVSHTYNQHRALPLSSTDQNGLVTKMFYDAFGTKVLTRGPTGLESAEITRPATSADEAELDALDHGVNLPPVKHIRKTQSSASPPAKAFIDSQGRVIATCTQTLTSFNGSSTSYTPIYALKVLDNAGREVQKSLPFATTDVAIYWQEVDYDWAGRPTKTWRPFADLTPNNGAETASVTFDGTHFITTLTSAEGQIQKRYDDLLGRLVRIEEVTGGTNVYYEYDIEGRVVKTVAPGNHIVRNTYDIFGNIETVGDTDAGVTTNIYNAFGEITESFNLAGDKTETGYDQLGRKTYRKITNGDASAGPGLYTKYFYDDTGGETAGASLGKLYKTSQWKGTSAGNESSAYYQSSTSFDRFGRPTETSFYYDQGIYFDASKNLWDRGKTYTEGVAYDSLGRVRVKTHSDGTRILNEYDSTYSTIIRIRNYETGQIYWEPRAYDSSGRVTSEIMGENLVRNDFDYFLDTGLMKEMESTRVSGSSQLQHYSYTWNKNGNLTTRTNLGNKTGGTAIDRKEAYTYDELDRVKTWKQTTVAGGSYTGAKDQIFQYDSTGNITEKDGVILNYDHAMKPHRLTSIETRTGSSYSYQYDNAGRITDDGRRDFTYTGFSKPSKITMDHWQPTIVDPSGNTRLDPGDTTVEFEYDAGLTRIHQRESRVANVSKRPSDLDTNLVFTASETFYYGAYEVITKFKQKAASFVFDRINLQTDLQEVEHRLSIGGFTLKSTKQTSDGTLQASTEKYLLKDHLGSLSAILNSSGNILERLAYGPWGQTVQSDWSENGIENSFTKSDHTNRGFTGHEMLATLGLVHMNGRIYDGMIGRFLSCDPVVQSPTNGQNFNRYSYVLNNPLSVTDPSGYFFKKLWKSIKKFFKAVLKIFSPLLANLKKVGRWIKKNWRMVVSIALAAVIAFFTAGAGLTVFGVSGSSLFGAGATGWAAVGWGAVNAGIGGALSGAASAAVHGGGIKDILKGALVGGITGAISGGILHGLGETGSLLTKTLKVGSLARQSVHVVAHGIVGGARNVAMGGKFMDGFLSAAAGAAAGYVPELREFINPAFAEKTGSNFLSRTAVAAVVGGTASALGGGKFANGAYTAAFQHLFNAEAGEHFKKYGTPKITHYSKKGYAIDEYGGVWSPNGDFKGRLGTHIFLNEIGGFIGAKAGIPSFKTNYESSPLSPRTKAIFTGVKRIFSGVGQGTTGAALAAAPEPATTVVGAYYIGAGTNDVLMGSATIADGVFNGGENLETLNKIDVPTVPLPGVKKK